MKINKIYPALEGEGLWIGVPIVFVRTQGCKIGCKNCDTMSSWNASRGTEMTPKEILLEVMKYDIDRVSITGGNPLEQADIEDLVQILKKRGFSINIEVTGQDDDEYIFEVVDSISMDIKPPSTGVVVNRQNIVDILQRLILKKQNTKLQLKCVVADDADYEFFRESYEFLYSRGLIMPHQMVITPCYTEKQKEFDFKYIEKINEMVLRDKLKVRVIMQQHKILYGSSREDV